MYINGIFRFKTFLDLDAVATGHLFSLAFGDVEGALVGVGQFERGGAFFFYHGQEFFGDVFFFGYGEVYILDFLGGELFGGAGAEGNEDAEG